MQLVNGPEGFTPDNEFILGESEVARPLRGGRLLRPRHRGRRRRRARMMAEWIARGRVRLRHLEDGHPPLRRGSTGAGDSPSPGSSRPTPTYYDIHYPNEERQAGRPLRRSPAYPRARPSWAASSARRAAGSARTGSRQRGARATSRPTGPGAGRASTGARPSAPRRWPAATPPPSSTRPPSPRWRSPAPGSAAFLERICANEVDRAGRLGHLHPAAATSGAASSATSPSPALADDRYLARHRHRLRQARPGLDPQAGRALPEGDGVAAPGRHRRPGPASGCGDRAARDVLQPLTTHRPRQRGVPVPLDAPSISRGPGAGGGGAGDLRGRAGMGALLPDRVRRAPSGTRCGRRASSTAWWPAATGPSTPCGWRRATGSGASTSRPRSTPYEAGLGFAVALDKPGGFVGREALRRGQGGRARPAVCAAWCSTTGSPWPSAASRCGWTARSWAGSPAANQGYRVGRSIAFAYLPADRAELGRRVEVEVFGEWIGATVVRDPLYDPAGDRIR